MNFEAFKNKVDEVLERFTKEELRELFTTKYGYDFTEEEPEFLEPVDGIEFVSHETKFISIEVLSLTCNNEFSLDDSEFSAAA